MGNVIASMVQNKSEDIRGTGNPSGADTSKSKKTAKDNVFSDLFDNYNGGVFMSSAVMTVKDLLNTLDEEDYGKK